jgi:hypothetical protein
MTPAAGTTDLLTIQRELSALEDRFLPLKFGDERRRLPLLAGMGYRAGKFIFFDIPQDHMLLVVGHEVFGHGARLRELGVGHIAYAFDGPVPYGEGGAATSFSGQLPDTPLAFLTIEMAGIEAQNVMADTIAERALSRGRLHYREAWLYFEDRYLGMTYMLSASGHSQEGHDVADFWKTFGDACITPACTPITLNEIKHGARWTLVDPMLYYAVYGFASSYIAQGRSTSPLPMIPLGHNLHVLPSAGFELTPYGTEYLLRSMLTAHGGVRATTFTVRVGNTGASTPWAVDMRGAGVPLLQRFRLRADGSVWRQPRFLADHTSAPLRTGASAAVTVEVPLQRLTRTSAARAIVTAGYKSDGFVPGERLSRGLILRAGIVLRR